MKLTKDQVTFSITTEPEFQSISEVLSFTATGADHSEYIQKVLDDNGNNPWLWCSVKVEAKFKSLDGVAYLGGCAYENEADFINDGYYEQMQDEALSDLQSKIDAIITDAPKLNIYQTKVGIMWVTWLGTSFQDRIQNSPCMADALTIGDSTKQFCKNLEKAIRAGQVSIFKGDVTLIDPANN